jgi:predicted component of type VI protein secretion system
MSTDSPYLRLEVISGNATGETIVVDDELVIGRHAEGPGRLSADEEISRHHARISREAAGDYAIEDLGSSNGTFVNGLRIQSPRLLELGDSIEVGATTLVVRAIVQPQSPQPPPAAAGAPSPDLRSAPTVFGRSPVAHEATHVEAPAPPKPTADPATLAPPVAAGTPASPAAPATQPPATPPAEPAALLSTPALKLEIDFDAREARIALGENGETVRLVFADGAWRVGGV